MGGWEAASIFVIKHGDVIVKSTSVSGPPLDHLVAFYWVNELDNGSCYVQLLYRVEVHQIIEVSELMEMLDSLGHFNEVWLTFCYV